jgi:hypothetical protein
MDPAKQKIYEALVDAVNKSPFYNNIPLPAILDNQLEELMHKYGYDKVPEEAKPRFEGDIVPKKEDDKEFPSVIPTKDDLRKKLKDKLKGLQKKRDKCFRDTLL